MARPKGPSKLDAETQELVRKYGITDRQLTLDTIEHLNRCTPLGREIMLIVMKLNAQETWRDKVKDCHRRHAAQHEKRPKMTQDERLTERRVRREVTKMLRKPPVKVPWVAYGKHSNEDGARVRRLMMLSEGRLA